LKQVNFLKKRVEVHNEWVHNTTEPLDDEFWIRKWDSKHNFNNHTYSNKEGYYSCPTHLVAREWIRLNFNLWIQVEFGKDEDNVWFGWYIYSLDKNYNYDCLANSESGFDSPANAIDDGLKYVLTNLI